MGYQGSFLDAYCPNITMAVRQSLGDSDPFRLRHRAVIGQFVREVVTGAMDKRAAAKWIAGEAGVET